LDTDETIAAAVRDYLYVEQPLDSPNIAVPVPSGTKFARSRLSYYEDGESSPADRGVCGGGCPKRAVAGVEEGPRMSSRLCAVSSVPAEGKAGADLILPCQYFDLSGGHHLTGEQRLMLALLTDAINVYQRGAHSGVTQIRRLYVDAEHWIMAESCDGNALSFDTVCDALGIHAALLRRRIIGWKHTVNRCHAEHQSHGLHLEVTPRERHSSHRRGRPPAADASVPT
jgi:hypothetical protein